MNTQKQKAIAPQSCGGGDTPSGVALRHRATKTSVPIHSSSSSKPFQRSGSNHPCPICGQTKDGDCSWNGEVYLCHSHVDVDAKTSGYVYRGAKDIRSLPSHERDRKRQLVASYSSQLMSA